MALIGITEVIKSDQGINLHPVTGKIHRVENIALSAINITCLLPGGATGAIQAIHAGECMDFWYDSTWHIDAHIPAGGAEGQVLSKQSSADFDLQWINPASDTLDNARYVTAPATAPAVALATLPSLGLTPAAVKSVTGTFQYKTTFCKEPVVPMPQYPVATVAAGTNPQGICYDGTNIWVTNYGTGNVTKITASTSVFAATVTAGTSPYGACFDGTNVWVANFGGNTVTKITASTNAIAATVAVGTGPWGICFDGTYVWVTNKTAGNIYKINASTNAVSASVTTGTSPYGTCFDGTNVWVTNYGSNTVMKINASTNTIATVINTGSGPAGICFDGTCVWVANRDSNTISKINASTGAISATISAETNPLGLCYDGSNIWVTQGGSTDILKINASANNVTSTIPAGSACDGICFDSTYIWVANYASNITKKFVSNHMQTYSVPETEGGAVSTAANLAATLNYFNLSSIPVSEDLSVKARKIYRYREGYKGYVLIGYINDNVTTTFREIPQDVDYVTNASLLTYFPDNFIPVVNTTGNVGKVNGKIVDLTFDSTRYV